MKAMKAIKKTMKTGGQMLTTMAYIPVLGVAMAGEAINTVGNTVKLTAALLACGISAVDEAIKGD